jgi:hypothetical protein
VAASRLADATTPPNTLAAGDQHRSVLMKCLVTALLFSALSLGAHTAHAAPLPAEALIHPIGMSGGIIVPVEWSGVWLIQDSTYDCPNVFKSTSTMQDTLCTGHVLEGNPTYVCTGSATATTFQQTCDGSFNLFPDCDAIFHLEIHGTRSGDSYTSVSTITVTTSGTGTGCDLYPPSCTQINSRGTRIAPEPAAYCASPVRESTWGALKVLYR